jgi:hemolysin III
MEMASSQPVKPRLRGVSHAYAFFVSLGCGVALILGASDGRARMAASVYAAAVSALLGTSALYHCVTWRPKARRWMRRLDHSMIFVLIAGTYTPVALLALKGSLASTILIVLWAGALGGVVFKLLWIDAPKWLLAAIYVALGLVSAAILGELPAAIGWLGVTGLAAGGLLYVVGAIVYASGRPNPWPRVFGYHEVFHALVLAAAALQYAVIAFAVLPRG